MSEKEIVYSILGREIDNLLGGNPSSSFLSGVVKKWIFNYIEPYVNLFMDGDIVQADMATAFVKEEMNAKIDNFKKKFMEDVKNEHNKN
jgi:hypothetical protein